jgi:hypothetical protein
MPTRVFIVAHLDEVIDGEVGERRPDEIPWDRQRNL